jgi:hypothetical protein
MTAPFMPGVLAATAPFYQLDAFGYPVAMALATLLGIGFGYTLERAGFSRSPVLAAEFYGRDMRVLKVMFTAIATTAVGLALLGGIGWVDLAALKIPETWLWPQLVGGVLLGMGFIMAGYCPGTSLVAAGSGYSDGLLTLVGVIVGSIVFGFAYPSLAHFYESSAMGVATLPKLTGLPWAVLAALIVVVALGSFLLAEKVERVFAKKDAAEPPPGNAPTRNRVLGGLAVAAGLSLVTLLLPAKKPPIAAEPRTTPITVTELARQIAADRALLYVVDARSPKECAAARIPGAMCLTQKDPVGAFIGKLPSTRSLVIYAAADLHGLPAGASGYKGQVRVLAGGYAAWKASVLDKPAPPHRPTAAAVQAYRERAALHAHFAGANAQAAPVVTAEPTAVKRAVKKGGGC